MIGEYDKINLEAHDKRGIFIRFYGLIYIVVLTAFIGLGISYLNHITFFAANKIVASEQETKISNDGGDIPLVKGSLSAPVDLKKISISTTESIEKGKTLYLNNCSSCHGNEGKGDGIAGASLNPKPRNFTVLTDWKNGFKVSQIYKTLHEGLTPTGMPAFASLTPEDKFAIIMFIRSLNPEYPSIIVEELDELDKTYSLSQGVKQPNQVPLKTAIQKMLNDKLTFEDKVKKIDSLIISSNDSAAVLFKSFINNSMKALTVLASDSSWNNNEHKFVQIISTDPVNNGFKAEVGGITTNEASMLFILLRKLFFDNITS